MRIVKVNQTWQCSQPPAREKGAWASANEPVGSITGCWRRHAGVCLQILSTGTVRVSEQ